MTAISALCAALGNEWPFDETPPAAPLWPRLPNLLARREINSETWSVIESVNSFVCASSNTFVATLWRHLEHWPGLLALTHAGFSPHVSNGAIEPAILSMVDSAQGEGQRMASSR